MLQLNIAGAGGNGCYTEKSICDVDHTNPSLSGQGWMGGKQPSMVRSKVAVFGFRLWMNLRCRYFSKFLNNLHTPTLHLLQNLGRL